MKPRVYVQIRQAVAAEGYADEIAWAQGVKEPESPEAFAIEAIWIICCSGMKEQVARKIQARVVEAIRAGDPISTRFGHKGKAEAMDYIWRNRALLFEEMKAAEDKLAFCAGLPWVGEITKWHLAKNLGVDCAKPDRHLERIAKHFKTTPHELCARLAKATGDRIATVDLVLWRAANLELIDTRAL